MISAGRFGSAQWSVCRCWASTNVSVFLGWYSVHGRDARYLCAKHQRGLWPCRRHRCHHACHYHAGVVLLQGIVDTRHSKLTSFFSLVPRIRRQWRRKLIWWSSALALFSRSSRLVWSFMAGLWKRAITSPARRSRTRLSTCCSPWAHNHPSYERVNFYHKCHLYNLQPNLTLQTNHQHNLKSCNCCRKKRNLVTPNKCTKIATPCTTILLLPSYDALWTHTHTLPHHRPRLANNTLNTRTWRCRST